MPNQGGLRGVPCLIHKWAWSREPQLFLSTLARLPYFLQPETFVSGCTASLSRLLPL